MNRSGWIAVVVVGIVVLMVLLAGMFLLGGGRYGGWYGMGPGMMGGWGFGLFGGIMMVFMWLVPLGLIALVVAGVIFLVRGMDNNRGLNVSSRNCPNCNRNVRNDWRNCPYCGHELTQ